MRPPHIEQMLQEEREKTASILKKGFKLQGQMSFQGLDIAVENKPGSVRKGVDKDGKPWRTVMKWPYGYIRGSKGADGEEVDCYVGVVKDAPNAYVVHQKKDDGSYDEDKVMLGFESRDAARKGYLEHYNTDKFLGPIKEVPMDRLKKVLESAKRLVKISFASSSYSSGTDFRTPVRPSRQQPGPPIPRVDRGGSPVPGRGFQPTNGGFFLASGVQGPVGLTKGAESGGMFRTKKDDEDEERREKEKDSDGDWGGWYNYGPGDFKPAKLNGRPKLAASPAQRLTKSRKVGTKPNAFGFKAQSIQQIAKPKGFGRAGAVPGTEEGGNI